ncbi:hypothetical protein DdX_11067 [Ditylenchus destructor]|uniref:Uncharacterized protein n=1 Tax=Ditylenchus destructor TaxID=166010 RepID=A0AAD4MZC3_9BILA|nr:hypothetical protein DdX_11067 [Ditylenchus destructor]
MVKVMINKMSEKDDEFLKLQTLTSLASKLYQRRPQQGFHLYTMSHILQGTVLLSSVTTITAAGVNLLPPVFNTVRYVACKPGELSVGFDGYTSTMEIGLMWLVMWSIIGGLYKINTGRWPPRPFMNKPEDDQPRREDTPMGPTTSTPKPNGGKMSDASESFLPQTPKHYGFKAMNMKKVFQGGNNEEW